MGFGKILMKENKKIILQKRDNENKIVKMREF